MSLDDRNYLGRWLIERQTEWENVSQKMRDLTFINQDVQDFTSDICQQADARAAECRALGKIVRGDND